MAKLLYVEPNDEITDLVDRIRRAQGDRDLVFVVPPEGRVLRSALDMRLLMQYTRGFQKRIAIVSGDAQVQGLAIRTGFPTFASLARLEQGAQLRAVPDVAAVAAAGAATKAAADALEATEPPQTQLAKRGPSALIAASAGGATGWWVRAKEFWNSQGDRSRLVAVSAAVVVALFLLFLFLPSATITLGVKAHRLNDTATIQGTTAPNSGHTLDQISTEALQSQTFTRTFNITPSGTQSLPPVPATGDLEFCLKSGGGSTTTLSFQGNAPDFQDSSTSGVDFTTTTGGEGQTVSPLPACSTGYSAGVAVQADANTVGTQGNVAASNTWTWANASSTECVSSLPGTCDTPAPALTITNQSATTGGTNATTQSVFSTSDAAAALQQQNTLDTSLTTKAENQLKKLAGSSVVAENSAGSGITVTVTNPTLPTGCNTSASSPCPAATAQTLTVSVSAAATAYSPSAAKAAVLQDLKSKVPADSELLADPDLGNLKVVSAGAGGDVTLTSRAVGYWAPTLNLTPFQSKLAFMSPGAARTYLLSQLPGASTVSISQFPFGLPWLPLLSGNIHLKRVSLSQRNTSG